MGRLRGDPAMVKAAVWPMPVDSLLLHRTFMRTGCCLVHSFPQGPQYPNYGAERLSVFAIVDMIGGI